MKIIHCSDLHLDSKMESNLPRKLANQRRAEIRETFLRLVRYAKEHGCSVVLLAGDMFDEARCSATTLEAVLDGIRNAPEVDFLYLKGNHDDVDLFAAVDTPDNFKRFSDSWVSYEYDGVVISGVELTRANYKTIYRDFAPAEGAANIVVLHGALSSSPGLDQIWLQGFEGKEIDHLALGHLHSYQDGALGSAGARWCYSGCLEGRGFDECGPKGFVEITIDEGSIKYAFVPFAKRTLLEVPVNITDCSSFPEMKKAIEQQIEEVPDSALVKIVLSGKYDPMVNKDLSALKEAFENSFFFVKVADESTLKIDPATFVNDVSLRGEYVRLVLSRDDLSDEDRDYVLNCGLRVLAGEDVF